jgi:hypothetical protein
MLSVERLLPLTLPLLRFISPLFPSLKKTKTKTKVRQTWRRLDKEIPFFFHWRLCPRVEGNWECGIQLSAELCVPSGQQSGSVSSQLQARVRCHVCGAQCVLSLCSLLLAVGDPVANPDNSSDNLGFSQKLCTFSANVFSILEIIQWPGSYNPFPLPYYIFAIQKRQNNSQIPWKDQVACM